MVELVGGCGLLCGLRVFRSNCKANVGFVEKMKFRTNVFGKGRGSNECGENLLPV